MHNSRHVIADTTRRFETHPGCRLRRADLRRWLVVCAAAPIAACQPAGVLDPQGPIASAERLLLINCTAIMLVVVVPVILATLGFAWWYRASNARASRASDEGYEGRIEFVVWSIPALIVILLGGVIWIGSHQLDPRAPILADPPADAKPLRVEVVALDWKWLFIYPDQGIAAVNQLVVPVGNPGRFPAHLGDGDEFVLRAAARQPDLHDGRHDYASQPARRPPGRVSRLLGKLQRRRVLRRCGLSPGRADRRFRRLDQRGARQGVGARRYRLYRNWQSRAKPCRRPPIAPSSPTCSNASSTKQRRVPQRAGVGTAWCPPAPRVGG